jgi:hypothetical protein
MRNTDPIGSIGSAVAVSNVVALLQRHWARVCAVLIGVGATLVLLALTGWLARDGLAAFVGGFLALYGSLVALQRRPPPWIGAALQSKLRATVVSSGVGFYGVMTLARLLQLELHELITSLGSLELGRGLLRQLLQQWLIGFSVESLRNTIEAFLWPVRLIRQHGMPLAAATVAATWGLYAVGARAFPDLHGAIEAAPSEPGPRPAGDGWH